MIRKRDIERYVRASLDDQVVDYDMRKIINCLYLVIDHENRAGAPGAILDLGFKRYWEIVHSAAVPKSVKRSRQEALAPVYDV